MAAPMEKSPSSYSSTSSSEELDLTSPKFNPLKSLYASYPKIPCPRAKLYNNIAQYESFMQGKDSESQRQKRPSKPHHPGLVAHKAAAQAREAVSKSRNAEEPKDDTRRKKMRRSNVLTLMEKHGVSKGPLSLLFHCVKDKLQILVVVRGAVSVHGYCKGYLIAFDKHFNMALLDVDENYLKAVTVPKKKSQESGGVETDYPDKSFTDKTDISHQQAERQEVVMEELLSQFTDTSVSTLQNTPRDANADTTDCGRSERVKHSKSQGVSQSLDVTKNEIKSIPKESASTCETGGNVLPAQCLRMESYKQLAESRSYAKFDIIRRHVNQLLIRGENVVSVSIAS